MQAKGKAALGFIFVTILLDVIGLGLVIPVWPRLIGDLIHADISHISLLGGWLTFAYAIMQFMFSPLIGGLSDRFGRRPVLLASLLGFALDYMLLFYAPNITWLFVGRIIAGITGASITTATAYIADISTPENRAQNFGMIGAAFGMGFIIGPVIGGLLGSYGPRLPFLVAAILTFLNFLYGMFVLPESLALKNRRKFEWRRANPVSSLLQLKKYKGIGYLMISYFLVYVAAHAVHSNWSYFVIEKFNWDEKTIGYSLGAIGLFVGLVQGVLIRRVNPRLGNERSVYIGLILYAIGMFLFAFASQSWMLFVFLIPYCLGGISGPALQSIISGAVPANEQGQLQGALTSIVSVTSIIGPPLMTGLFAWFTGPNKPFHFSGISFFLGGVLMLISAYIAYKVLKKHFGKPATAAL